MLKEYRIKCILFIFVTMFISLACNLNLGPTPPAENINKPEGTSEIIKRTVQTMATDLAKETDIKSSAVAEESTIVASQTQATVEAIATTEADAIATAVGATRTALSQQATVESQATLAVEDTLEDTGKTPLALTNITEELAKLGAYRFTISITFKSENNQTDHVDTQIGLLIEHSTTPQASHMGMLLKREAISNTEGDISLDIYNADKTLYIQKPQDGEWLSIPLLNGYADIFSEGFFAPDNLLAFPQMALQSQATHQVNGISAWKYTFDENDMQAGDIPLEEAFGVLWLANDGNYPVKYTLETTGTLRNPDVECFFSRGTFIITYELLAIESEVAITIPEDAFGFLGLASLSNNPNIGELDLLIPPDAEIDVTLADLINYRTDFSVGELVNFYRTRLLDQGWTPDPEANLVKPTNALLTFSKGDLQLLVDIGLEEETRVLVNLYFNDR